MEFSLAQCELCPRKCGADRYNSVGVCGVGDKLKIARADLHFWEEPCISGNCGSGAVFFSGCSLKCCFCQNYEISHVKKGFEVSTKRLADIFLTLQQKGAHNINLVNPTHFVLQIIEALDLLKEKLHIPIVYNCGGYERVETLELLRGYVNIFLPDLKFFDPSLSQKYCNAKDYFENTSQAIRKMVELVGSPKIENGIMKNGVVIRHLVMPNCRHDSEKIIDWIGENFSPDEVFVSLMSQYTPIFKAFDFKEISRKTSTFEYNTVVKRLESYGFNGYVQEKTSADEGFIPNFFDKDLI